MSRAYLDLARKLIAERFQASVESFCTERITCMLENGSDEQLHMCIDTYADRVEAQLFYREAPKGDVTYIGCASNLQMRALEAVLASADRAGILERFTELHGGAQ